MNCEECGLEILEGHVHHCLEALKAEVARMHTVCSNQYKKYAKESERWAKEMDEKVLQIDELKDDLADECDTSQKLSQKVIETERLIGELKAVIQKITFKSFDGHYNNTFSDGVPLEEECPDIVKAFDQQQTEKRNDEGFAGLPEKLQPTGGMYETCVACGTSKLHGLMCPKCFGARQ